MTSFGAFAARVAAKDFSNLRASCLRSRLDLLIAALAITASTNCSRIIWRRSNVFMVNSSLVPLVQSIFRGKKPRRKIPAGLSTSSGPRDGSSHEFFSWRRSLKVTPFDDLAIVVAWMPDLLLIKCLAVTYSCMPKGQTTIGAEHFHFRVRYGIGWFLLAMAARQTGCKQWE